MEFDAFLDVGAWYLVLPLRFSNFLMTATPSETSRRLQFLPPAPLLKGLDSRVDGLVGIYRRRARVVAELRREAEEIDARAGEWKSLDSFHLRQKLLEFRERFRRGGRDVEPLLLQAPQFAKPPRGN